MDASASCSSNTDKCKCENLDSSESKDQLKSTTTNEIAKERKSRISFPSFNLLRKSRVLNFTNSRKGKKEANIASSKKASRWTMKFNCSKKEPKNDETQSCCQCTCYKRSEEMNDGASTSSNSDNVVPKIEQASVPPPVLDNLSVASDEECEGAAAVAPPVVAAFDPVVAGPSTEPEQPAVSNEAEPSPEVLNRGFYSNSSGNIVLSVPIVRKQWIQLGWIHEDCDEAARIQRAREIEQGVEAPANFRPVRRVQLLYTDSETEGGQAPRRLQLVCPPDLSVDSLRAFFQNRITLRSCPLDTIAGCHTQVDFIHCLVPDLLAITNCSFYWGKMDRYEAERLLDGKTEGTFLLRDSAQEEFLFSVSFRKYNRSLHARIEQWNHKFSFDAHDPGVYTSDTVCGLIEHYKDPGSCMFFEPVLTWPLHRNFSFSLQHLCRSVIVDRLHYDDINQLQLPKCLKSYLKEYHYRQKVRVERFDDDVQWLDCRNVPS